MEQEHNTITDKILDKIKDIKPKSRFSFLAKNYAFWGAGVVSIVIGAITVSAILFVLLNQDWDLTGRAGGMWHVLLFVLPYFWIAVFVLFVIIAYYEVRHIEGGYRVTLPIIIGAYFVASIVLGIGMYTVGVGERTEKTFVDHAPLYGRLSEPRHEIWHSPEQGLLLGMIAEIQDDKIIILNDIEQEVWTVNIVDVRFPPSIPSLQVGMLIKCAGEVTGDHMFEAEIIRPHLMPMHPMMKNMKEIDPRLRISR
ncbi:MAG TPA: hypothetical protein DCS29_00225 [Candidatus Magasanikbacteria bacterium]|nr:MAG: hypothetical protein A2479_03250 [Candidatus Magasanikbacteria bacterium RIFOXYC2_FULL_39_8]HAT03191.1 hypothetical protein [Candidatus Magasanikbacteria bacterium]